ncbi:G-type lectin S-receptor-like serine/threonine-protein kinase LECRK2 [Asparagus officinalis]|uniref:G-type lectin S-receptor-like serine/threonine-protein kinase LECRK2 n=1 Tax=Asparagus officinalis TaxID=4686 RepID=UPI00098DFF91|nr:G-type lectin S-receptor-like serine/threonine-protein kinase LECRK2 [Asparagus officinalis]
MASSSFSFAFYSVFLIVLLAQNNLSAQGYQNISLGTTFTPLTQLTSWPSPSGDFAFGFLPLETDPSQFLLAVWFNKLPNKTVVWMANRDSPVRNGSKAELTFDGNLSLTDQTGREIWNASVNTATYASMLDNGNFVLSGTDWQSFCYPTDTILPGQILNQGVKLYAKIMDDDYSRGRIELTLQDDGNLVLYPVAYPTAFAYDAYWSTSTSGSGINKLVFNESTGSAVLSYPNGTAIPVLWSVPAATGGNYLRATLDPDGVFRLYAFPKNSLSTGRWGVKAFVPSDICESLFESRGSGACGFNSFCVLDADGRADCRCPPHYSFLDPDRIYKGCKADFISQSCDLGGETAFNFTEITNVDWPLADAEEFSPMGEADCTDNCLKDCFCSVAIYNNETCWKKKFPLSNGRGGSDVNRKAFIKFSTVSDPASLIKEKKEWKTPILVGSLVFGCSAVLVPLIAFVMHKRNMRALPRTSGAVIGPALCSFTYKELERATKGFNEEIGKGAFGTVYKGVLPSQPATHIAVKKLESLSQDAEKDFTNEVATIGLTYHKNLVRLLGFCKEGTHLLMVFELMSNGSLNRLLFRSDRPEWNQRVKIALGIAEGLAYLHDECRTQIIHCDIKPQNILLDDNFEARISDFGLAKLLRLDQTRTSTGIRGTIGYFAPEWFKNVAITAKVDVYSYGVMLLEIICCRRNFEWGPESQEKLTVIGWAKECYKNGRLDLLVAEDEEAKKDGTRLERLVMVAISCVQDEPWLRPSMKKVVQMLEGAISVSLPPNMCSILS